ncbi:unnamed protein product [Nippostrongylus brasiliensis]|uniref:Uncharacterized protein n=1 Tax=Nippostrongylus brasiliensis TaxID=27835 RepID=A0A0N4YWA4_NIPBR|nr:unnamed protein product [Nippostrongylus brasiliensis]
MASHLRSSSLYNRREIAQDYLLRQHFPEHKGRLDQCCLGAFHCSAVFGWSNTRTWCARCCSVSSSTTSTPTTSSYNDENICEIITYGKLSRK